MNKLIFLMKPRCYPFDFNEFSQNLKFLIKSMHKYKLISKKGEGTFSEVIKAQSIKTGKYVAIKCMKNHFNSIDQVNNLREIQALRRLSPHPHIVKFLEVLYDEPTGRLALVFELMELNMYEWIRGRKSHLPEQKIKNYIYQLLKALEHMHSNGIFHRDIKPENVLLAEDTLKLADFGSCRGIHSKQPYTEYISTRWYRSPECLLTDGYYNYKMDIWGVGCVFFEISALIPLFPGKNELDQINKIHNILGTPSQKLLEEFKSHASHMEINFPAKEGVGFEKNITHMSGEARDLIRKMLTYNHEDRITCKEALNHSYFREIHEENLKRVPSPISSKLPQPDIGGGEVRKKEEKPSKHFLPVLSKSHHPKNTSVTKISMAFENKSLVGKSYGVAQKNPSNPAKSFKSYY